MIILCHRNKTKTTSSSSNSQTKCILFIFLIVTISILNIIGFFIHQYGFLRVQGFIEGNYQQNIVSVISNRDSKKILLPRLGKIDNIQLFVISLKRAKERREFMKNQLNSVKYEFIEGIDGRKDNFSSVENDLEEYIGQTRLIQSGLNLLSCRQNRENCPKESSQGERAKIALDLTYIQIFKRIVSSNDLENVIILEDDAVILTSTTEADFISTVAEKMEYLPIDWDLLLLYMYETNKKERLGGSIGNGLYIVNNGVGTVGLVVNRKLAQFMLQASKWGMKDLYIDLFMCGHLPFTGRINAYLTLPFLVSPKGFDTTIARRRV